MNIERINAVSIVPLNFSLMMGCRRVEFSMCVELGTRRDPRYREPFLAPLRSTTTNVTVLHFASSAGIANCTPLPTMGMMILLMQLSGDTMADIHNARMS